jgi:hypothetical protein
MNFFLLVSLMNENVKMLFQIKSGHYRLIYSNGIVNKFSKLNKTNF